jgi:hypothetical protein
MAQIGNVGHERLDVTRRGGEGHMARGQSPERKVAGRLQTERGCEVARTTQIGECCGVIVPYRA